MVSPTTKEPELQIASQSERVRILLVDDHPIIRVGLKRLIETDDRYEVIAAVDDAEAAVEFCRENNPNVVIMDLAMSGVGGIEGIRRIHARNPRIRILAFSLHLEPVFVEHAFKAGASGYVSKEVDPGFLLEAIMRIANGRRVIDPKLIERQAFGESIDRETVCSTLTTREFEIFCLLTNGRSPREIAKLLSLSQKTVANYVSSVKSKLAIDSMNQLIRMGMDMGLGPL